MKISTEGTIILKAGSTHLPIDDFIDDILQKVTSHTNLVITAAPGAGKTTRLPPELLSVVAGKILVLEPRRMASIAAAHRVAEEHNWLVGEEVGYQVRFVNKTSHKTRLIYMTEALLARHMIHHPELDDVDIVILDEFHERSLYVDLTLGLIRELQELGHHIKIVVMSATLEAEKIAEYLGNCPVISVPGKLFELTVRYQKSTQLLTPQYQFYEHLSQVIKEAQRQTDKDILVFLPGAGEIERAKVNLLDWAESKNIEVITLHGSLPLEAQRIALQKSSAQRIILATNIAESSVTLNGVDTVIDSGLVKIMKQDLRTGFSRLEISRISLASAIQRAGRAARQFPGVCYRMWNQHDESSFVKSNIPEILHSDLSDSLLFLANQHISNFQNFSWFERPPRVNIERATFSLQAAGAIENNNELTSIGRQLLDFPLPLRLGRLLIAGIENNCIDLAAKIAALLQERDILRKEMANHFQADHFECDVTPRLNILNKFLKDGSSHEGHFTNLQTVAQSYQQILDLAKKLKNAEPAAYLEEDDARQLLLMLSFGDRLCRRRKNSDRALMVGGRGVKLSDRTLVKRSEFFIALNGFEESGEAETLINQASGINKEFLFKHFSDSIIKKRDIIFEAEKSQFYQREFKTIWDLPIEEPNFSLATSAHVAEKLPDILTDNWASTLKKNENLHEWYQKIIFLRFHKALIPPHIQDELESLFDGDALKKSFCLTVFRQACFGESKMTFVLQKNLVYFFELNISETLRSILQTELPNRLKVPSGSMIPLHYSTVEHPFLRVRIQEVFGWEETPKILFQNVSVVLHLLGPNFRPVQITSDLESFWKNGYLEIRKELRIRYPKHQWPLNPADGIAHAKGSRRK